MTEETDKFHDGEFGNLCWFPAFATRGACQAHTVISKDGSSANQADGDACFSTSSLLAISLEARIPPNVTAKSENLGEQHRALRTWHLTQLMRGSGRELKSGSAVSRLSVWEASTESRRAMWLHPHTLNSQLPASVVPCCRDRHYTL